MCGAVLTISLYAFMTYRGTALPFMVTPISFLAEHEVSQTLADFPNEIGSTSSLNRDISAENSVELRVQGDTHVDAEQHWEMNYHEAAIFLEVCSMSYIGTVCMIIV